MTKFLVENVKLFTVLGAIGSYGASYYFLAAGYPTYPLYVALFASVTAIALMLVEWAQR